MTLGWVVYKQQKFLFHSSGGWKPEVRVPVASGSGEGSSSALRAADFSLCLYVAEG